MDNAAIADNFSLLSKLMDIHGENSFKTKTYSIAAYNIEKMPVQLKDVDRSQLFSIKGIGDSVGKKVIELLDDGHIKALEDYIQNTPPGVIEMLNIKGIGPKKIHTIWKEMGLESIGELQYACEENRLTLFKGFGEKTQQNVKESIDFYLLNQGHFLYAQVFEIFPQVKNYLENLFGAANIKETGAFRRQETTIEELEFVVKGTLDDIKPKFQTAYPPETIQETADTITYKLKNGLKLKLYAADDIVKMQFLTSASEEYLQAFQKKYPKVSLEKKSSEDDIYKAARITYQQPYFRNFEKDLSKNFDTVIQPGDVKGLIHSHSNWSDGANTIEEMAADLIKKGFEYLVISDHSKTAVYAQGLNEERVKEQHKYIDQLNQKFKPFKIFKSIESDILGDGSLDYSNDILSTFDLVIASVHSNLKMTQEKAMTRVMKAIENPYTTILGHMTGRLLLSRNGYPLDHKTIIDACAANDVVIELNAHPRRLDIDWRYIDYAIEKNVLISIDPDAHELSGFNDIRFGVFAAQKAGVKKENNFSSYSLKEFENFLQERKKKKGI